MPNFSVILWIFIGTFSESHVQVESSQITLADYLFSSGDFEESITEYKRYIFFNPSSEIASYVYYKIGLAYRNKMEWEESWNALLNSIKATYEDSVKNETEIQLGVNAIASRDYSLAEVLFREIESTTRYPNIRQKSAFFLGVTYIYQFKWKKASEIFNFYFKDDVDFRSVDSLLQVGMKLNYKSSVLAQLLSTLLPGAGQLYVGDLKNALNAFAINCSTGFLLCDQLYQDNPTNAVLVYLFIFRRYYDGNRYHAGRIAREYNQHLNLSNARTILELLKNP